MGFLQVFFFPHPAPSPAPLCKDLCRRVSPGWWQGRAVSLSTPSSHPWEEEDEEGSLLLS